jgi:chain length determinant protein tyrosine kinase EpsG
MTDMGVPDEVPGVSRASALKRPDRSIGAVLVDAGRLRPEDAQRILRLHHEKGLRFGDAGKALGLLTQGDIEFALSRQFDYPYLKRGESLVSEEIVAAYAPFTAQVESMRALRSQLMLRWFDFEPPRKALAIVSAARNEGRSFIAANLAVLFSQLGKRTLLIDTDMRNPRQHQLFGLDNRAGLSAVLSGRAGPESVQLIPALHHLSVLPAGAVPPNPLELLSRPIFGELLHQLAAQLDVILLDSPAAAGTADAQIAAVRAGAALIVARRGATRLWRVQGVSESVAQAKVTIVGAVLNDF